MLRCQSCFCCFDPRSIRKRRGTPSQLRALSVGTGVRELSFVAASACIHWVALLDASTANVQETAVRLAATKFSIVVAVADCPTIRSLRGTTFGDCFARGLTSRFSAATISLSASFTSLPSAFASLVVLQLLVSTLARASLFVLFVRTLERQLSTGHLDGMTA